MMRAGGRTGRMAGLSGLVALALATIDARPAPAAQPAAAAGVIAERPALTEVVRQPFHVVRTLAALQERVAQGDETAFALQTAVVQEIAQELKTFPLEVWSEPRNRQALIKYALSGGDPEMLRTVATQKFFPEAEQPLARAALAYAEGHRSVALRLLEKVDVFALPPSLAGHVALVKAIVVANTDLARVIRLSDEARLLSPGTLVEETALRLAIEAAISQGNRAKFEAIALRYFRRFPRSPYLAAVIRPVAAAIAENGYSERPEGAKWVHSVVHYLDPNKLVQFYAALAEVGLRSTKLATTVNAARMVRKYARGGSPEYAWAQAYEGAALVASEDIGAGLKLLADAESAGVSAPVAELIAGARAIAGLIQAPPPPPLPPPLMPAEAAAPEAAAKAPSPKQPASAPSDAKARAIVSSDQHPAAGKARARIAQIDRLLEDIDE